MDQRTPSPAARPEKPAAVRSSQPPQAFNQPGVQPLQQPLQPLSAPQPEAHRPSKQFEVAKVVMGSFNFVFAIVLLGLSLSLIGSGDAYDSFLMALLGAIFAVASLVWQLAEFITLCARGKLRGIHPGAHVAIHLILWLLGATIVGMLSAVLATTMSNWTVRGSDDDENINYYYYYTFSSVSAAETYFRVMEAIIAFSALLLIGHFLLFVLACVETNRRNKLRRKTVYILATPGPDGRLYYAPLPPDGVVQPVQPAAQPGPIDLRTSQMSRGPMPMAPQNAYVGGANGNADASSDPSLYGYYAPTGDPAPPHNGTVPRGQPSSPRAGPSSPPRDRPRPASPASENAGRV